MYLVTFYKGQGETRHFGPFDTEKEAKLFVEEKHAALALFGFICATCHGNLCLPYVEKSHRCGVCHIKPGDAFVDEFLKVERSTSPASVSNL